MKLVFDKFMDNLSKFQNPVRKLKISKRANREISTPVGIIIILLIAILAGGILAWQWEIVPEYEVLQLEIPPKPEKKVTITTDKTEYEQGELIKITIRNDLSESIFSHTDVFCIEYIERKTSEGNWEKLFAQCQYPHCLYKIGGPKEIKPGQSVTFEWEPLIYVNGTPDTVQMSPGIYRLKILYQIRKGPISERWEWKTIYSDEFTIKEKKRSQNH